MTKPIGVSEYRLFDDVTKELQESETSAYKWVTAAELCSMPRNELATMRM